MTPLLYPILCDPSPLSQLSVLELIPAFVISLVVRFGFLSWKQMRLEMTQHHCLSVEAWHCGLDLLCFILFAVTEQVEQTLVYTTPTALS